MKEVKTKFGTLYYELMPSLEYALLDSEERVLFSFYNKKELKKFLKKLETFNTIQDWLKTFDDVCWGSKKDIVQCAKDYHEMNGRKVDKKYIEETYNKIGNTYILFEYSECYL